MELVIYCEVFSIWICESRQGISEGLELLNEDIVQLGCEDRRTSVVWLNLQWNYVSVGGTPSLGINASCYHNVIIANGNKLQTFNEQVSFSIFKKVSEIC